MATAATADALRIEGLRTLKFAVSDCDRALAFYERVFGVERIPAIDHRDADGAIYAYVCRWPAIGALLDLRLLPAHAAAAKRMDTLSLAVEGRANLEAWVAHLDALGAPHSGVVPTGLSWCVVIEDPDGRYIKLFARQGHGPEIGADKDNPWMRN